MSADKRGHGDKRERKRELAIAALLTSPSVEAAAKAVGVADATLRRWMAEEDFRAELRQARSQVLEHALNALGGALVEAVDALVRNLRCRRPSVEVAAARAIFELANQQAQLDQLGLRLERLEHAIETREP